MQAGDKISFRGHTLELITVGRHIVCAHVLDKEGQRIVIGESYMCKGRPIHKKWILRISTVLKDQPQLRQTEIVF